MELALFRKKPPAAAVLGTLIMFAGFVMPPSMIACYRGIDLFGAISLVCIVIPGLFVALGGRRKTGGRGYEGYVYEYHPMLWVTCIMYVAVVWCVFYDVCCRDVAWGNLGNATAAVLVSAIATFLNECGARIIRAAGHS